MDVHLTLSSLLPSCLRKESTRFFSHCFFFTHVLECFARNLFDHTDGLVVQI